MAISPDGRSLVFAATSKVGGAEQFWLRRLDSLDVTPIPGTESTYGALAPQSPWAQRDAGVPVIEQDVLHDERRARDGGGMGRSHSRLPLRLGAIERAMFS